VINVPIGKGWRRSKVGYINRHGVQVIPPRFDDGLNFSEGLAAAKLGKKWGFIDRSGEFAIPPEFPTFSRFHEGLAIMSEPKRWGLFSRLPVRTFSNLDKDLAEIWRRKRFGFIDRFGKVILGYEYSMAGDFSEGAAYVPQFRTKDFKAACSFIDGIGCVPVDHKFGYINRKGEFLIPPEFDTAGAYSEGLACVRLGDHYGFIDKIGQFKIAARFNHANDFSGSLALVRVGERRGFISLDGGHGYPPAVYRSREF
jgi:hypothetical protein